MNKKLTTKVQKITPKISTPDNGLSSALEIIPDNELDLEKKELYILYLMYLEKKTSIKHLLKR